MTVLEPSFAPKELLPNGIQSSTRLGLEARMVPFCSRNPTSSFFYLLLFYLTRYCRGVYPHCLRRTGEARQVLGNVFLHVSSTTFSENRWPTHFHKAMLALWFFCPPCGSAHKCSLIPVPTRDVLKIPVPYVPNMAKLINSIFRLPVKAIWNFVL